MLVVSFGALQVIVLGVLGVNIKWSVKTLKDVAAVEEVAQEVLKAAEFFEQNQQAIEQNVARLEQNLQGFELDVEVLQNNPPVAPIEMHGTMYTLNSRQGKEVESFCECFVETALVLTTTAETDIQKG